MGNKIQKEVTIDTSLIAFCGLYCGACRFYLSGKCPGCRENQKATWCAVRRCCMENSLPSCADCKSTGLVECKKFNNFFSKFFAIVFNSNRKACIEKIRTDGYEKYAADMASLKKQSLPRKQRV